MGGAERKTVFPERPGANGAHGQRHGKGRGGRGERERQKELGRDEESGSQGGIRGIGQMNG